jgi:hypothetical protein
VILPTFLALALPLAALWRLLDRALRDMRLAFGLALWRGRSSPSRSASSHRSAST